MKLEFDNFGLIKKSIFRGKIVVKYKIFITWRWNRAISKLYSNITLSFCNALYVGGRNEKKKFKNLISSKKYFEALKFILKICAIFEWNNQLFKLPLVSTKKEVGSGEWMKESLFREDSRWPVKRSRRMIGGQPCIFGPGEKREKWSTVGWTFRQECSFSLQSPKPPPKRKSQGSDGSVFDFRLGYFKFLKSLEKIPNHFWFIKKIKFYYFEKLNHLNPEKSHDLGLPCHVGIALLVFNV